MLTKNIDEMKAITAEHIAADAVIQGSYWLKDESDLGGKGCFIGCLTHGTLAANVTEKFGIPEPLVLILERLFERLPFEDGKLFFGEIPEAIGADGKDLSLIHWAFLKQMLENLPTVADDIQSVIDPVIAGLGALASGGDWPETDAKATAEAAARAAARTAEAVARAAAWTAEGAARTAWTAEGAARTAEAVARAADAYCQSQRKVIIEMLTEA